MESAESSLNGFRLDFWHSHDREHLFGTGFPNFFSVTVNSKNQNCSFWKSAWYYPAEPAEKYQRFSKSPIFILSLRADNKKVSSAHLHHFVSVRRSPISKCKAVRRHANSATFWREIKFSHVPNKLKGFFKFTTCITNFMTGTFGQLVICQLLLTVADT